MKWDWRTKFGLFFTIAVFSLFFIMNIYMQPTVNEGEAFILSELSGSDGAAEFLGRIPEMKDVKSSWGFFGETTTIETSARVKSSGGDYRILAVAQDRGLGWALLDLTLWDEDKNPIPLIKGGITLSEEERENLAADLPDSTPGKRLAWRAFGIIFSLLCIPLVAPLWIRQADDLKKLLREIREKHPRFFSQLQTPEAPEQTGKKEGKNEKE